MYENKIWKIHKYKKHFRSFNYFIKNLALSILTCEIFLYSQPNKDNN